MATLGLAVRLLNDLVNDRNTSIAKHPEDFILYLIGEFNDSTAETINKIPPEMVCMASDHVKMQIPDLSSIIKTNLDDKTTKAA